MAMKNDAKFEKELTFQFKIDLEIQTRALKNLESVHFNGLLLTKVYNVLAQKVQRSYL